MNLRIVFKFKDCKLQFYEKRRLFSYFSVNPRTPANRWRRLLKPKRKKINSFKIIFGFFSTPPLFLATKVAIWFVYYSPKTIKCTQKPKIDKKVYRNRHIERASERVPFATSYLQLALDCSHVRNPWVKNVKHTLLYFTTANKHRTTTILPLKLDMTLFNLTKPKIKAGRSRGVFFKIIIKGTSRFMISYRKLSIRNNQITFLGSVFIKLWRSWICKI